MESDIKKISRFIESTNLSAVITGGEVDDLIKEAKGLGVFGVCVPPFWVKRASREIGNSELQLVTVAGFPLGFQMTETKVEETRLALRDGANEIDVVLHLTSFANNMPWTKIELVKLSKLIHDEGALMKVIIEADLWSEEQLSRLCRLVADSGADFLKTSTGYHRKPVTAELITKLRKWLPSNVGIKASGGIANADTARKLIDAGADRIGTSKAKEILL